MKRSYEEMNQIVEDEPQEIREESSQEIEDDSSQDSSSSTQDIAEQNSSDCESSSSSQDIAEQQEIDEQDDSSSEIDNTHEVFSLTEREIVRNVLSHLYKSNMYDWSDPEIDPHMMGVCDFAIRNDSYKQVSCGVSFNVYFSGERTYCIISYVFDDSEPEIMRLSWDTATDGTNRLIIVKCENERHWLLFNRKVAKTYFFDVKDIPSDHWCYFPDVRIHLNRIYPC